MAEDTPRPEEEQRTGTWDDSSPAEPADPVLARLLADPAVWVEARPSLEDDVARAVGARAEADARARRAPHRWRRTSVLVTAAAAAAILAIVMAGIVVGRDNTSRHDFAARLTGTKLAPSARASAEVTRRRGGFTVTLDAQGLARLPAGEFYQAWLKSDAGTLVPIGTFSSSDSRITLWSGVSPNEFPTMTVTIERADGRETSSGRRVLSGTVHPR